MLIKVQNLQPGCILKKDVFGKTNHPIIRENTLLNEKHIEILQAFLIKEIEIKNEFDQSKETNDQEVATEQLPPSTPKVDISFKDHYLEAVEHYQQQFLAWQSSLTVHFANIREFLIPLLESVEIDDSWIHMIHLLSNKDHLFHRPIAVSLIAHLMAKGIGYDKGQRLQVAYAGCLIDCGLVKLAAHPKLIEKMIEDRSNDIEKHPMQSYQMVKHLHLLKPETKLAIYQHHERLDGTGYPVGEKGFRIHTYAQIIAIADTYYEMTAMNGHSPFRALQMMEEEQFGKFNTSMLHILTSAIAYNPVGTMVKLSNGQKGKILFIKPDSLTRPLIQLIDNDQIMDLEKSRQLFIEEVML